MILPAVEGVGGQEVHEAEDEVENAHDPERRGNGRDLRAGSGVGREGQGQQRDAEPDACERPGKRNRELVAGFRSDRIERR